MSRNIEFIQIKNHAVCVVFYFCDPAGTRTQDPNIKSVVLYQLSYGIFYPPKRKRRRINSLVFWECKNRVITFRSQTFKKNVFTSFQLFKT